MMRRIIIIHDHPPIALRDFDYSATLEDYEPGDPIGRGQTAQIALGELLEQLEEWEWV